jgi:hypothetical protein
MQIHKLEFKERKFLFKRLHTTEDGGESYDMLFTGINVIENGNQTATWFGEYAGAYVQATLGGAQIPKQLTMRQELLQILEDYFLNCWFQICICKSREADVLKGSN